MFHPQDFEAIFMELAPRSLVVVSLREVDLGRFGFVLKTVLRKQSRLNKSFTNVRIKIAYDKSLGIEGYDLFGHEQLESMRVSCTTASQRSHDAAGLGSNSDSPYFSVVKFSFCYPLVIRRGNGHSLINQA